MKMLALGLVASRIAAFASPVFRPRSADGLALPRARTVTGKLALHAISPQLTVAGAGKVGQLLALRGGSVVGGPASLLPVAMTLGVALWTKQVAVALLCGIISGQLLLCGSPTVAFLRAFDTSIIDAVSDRQHATVIIFNFILGGTIGLVQKGGGALGLAKALKRFAKDAKSCVSTAAFLAGLIFFDDYAR